MDLLCIHEQLEICNQYSYICLENIYGHWYYNQTVTATIQNPPMPPPILDLIAIQPRSRSCGALNWRQNPFTNERDNQLGLIHRDSSRRNVRRGGCKAQTGTSIRGTRRKPSGFEIANNELPSSM